MKIPPIKNENWLTLFLVLPLVSIMTSLNTIDFGVIKTTILCTVLGIIGLILYEKVKQHSNKTKTIVLLIWITSIVIITIVFVKIFSKIDNNLKEDYTITCPVCGYIELSKDDKLCGECFVEFTEKEMKAEGYINMDEFLREEQFYYFCDDTISSTHVNFYTPKINEEGFKKDMNWKPIVSQEEILNCRQQYVNAPKHDVKIQYSINDDSVAIYKIEYLDSTK